MFNMIILLKSEEKLTRTEYKKFSKGDTIYGCDTNPIELKRWSIDDKQDAQDELAKYKCTYDDGAEICFITEYALEYCECDVNGEFVSGSDFVLARE